MFILLLFIHLCFNMHLITKFLNQVIYFYDKLHKLINLLLSLQSSELLLLSLSYQLCITPDISYCRDTAFSLSESVSQKRKKILADKHKNNKTVFLQICRNNINVIKVY